MRIVSAVVLAVFLFQTGVFSGHKKETVRIDILSKQVRLLRQGISKRIVFIPSSDSKIHILSEGRISRPHEFSLAFSGGKPFLFSQDFTLTPEFRMRIESSKPGDTIRVKLDSEERLYPLPLDLVYTNSSFKITVQESLKRYAVHSACAEYGKRSDVEKEAVLALAHVIMARARCLKGKRLHENVDFCDLTHCQVYRGIPAYSIDFNDLFSIDAKQCNKNLFFNSCCGGWMFSANVFNGKGKLRHEKDWLYHSGKILCESSTNNWKRIMSADELCEILIPDALLNTRLNDFLIEKRESKTLIAVKGREYEYPLERFRIFINRKKGWNFIKSNNYSLKYNPQNKIIEFMGKGLGHGVGLCQKGALQLSRMGYSRFEIIKHYYPEIIFTSDRNNALPPYLSYVIFNLKTGGIIEKSQSSILNREIVPGSFFKLPVSLYLAHSRPDIMREYTYECRGKSQNKNMPERCWNPDGHGRISMSEALPKSCNLFFASLYSKIDFDSFEQFIKKISDDLSVDIVLPEHSGEKQKAEILSGLDFRMKISVKDMIRITRVLSPVSCYDRKIHAFRNRFQTASLTALQQSLRGTFVNGTASGSLKSKNRYSQNLRDFDLNDLIYRGIWGKTSTVIDGTNTPVAYGLFTGGVGNKGIICIMRDVTGHTASRWAAFLLNR